MDKVYVSLMGVKVVMLTWLVFSFLLGSLPFSLWLARLAGKDLSQVADGNPGATNTWRAAGWQLGSLAFLLDISKGAFPVAMAAQIWGWHGSALFGTAIAPLLGSAFSPFLHGRGGKSLAVSFGIWIGLMTWQAPLVILPGLILMYWLQTSSLLAVLTALTCTALYLLRRSPEAAWWWVWGTQLLIITWKHRADWKKPPRWRWRTTGKTR